MNKQEKVKNGVVVGRGIQWTDYTINPIAGCQHRCRWTMPDGGTAICYAELVANKFKGHYPQGFEAHYWYPERLSEPTKVKTPSKIFIDSMSDLFGNWVNDDQIDQVFKMCRQASWHEFQALTKNAPRLVNFEFPKNLWIGVSSPPDEMRGKRLSPNAQWRMLDKSLKTLGKIHASVKWMSFEPLSWDVSEIVADNKPLDWAVIGAATKGAKVYQPDHDHVNALLEVLDRQKVPVFFKGNLWSNGATSQWREYFPGFVKSKFLVMSLGKHALPLPEQIPRLF